MIFEKKNNLLFLIIFTLLIILFSRWFFSFYFNTGEDLLTRIIFDLDDWQYLTLAYNFSNLDFNPSYDPNLTDLRYLPIPIYSLLFHAFFIKLFNIYSFLILEFTFIVIFFYIFIIFFQKIGLDKIECLALSLLIFCIPAYIYFAQIILPNINIPFITSLSFYELRFPRPSISKIYLLFFLLILIFKNKGEKFKFWELSSIGFIFAAMFGSVYYNLITSIITFTLYYFYIVSFDLKDIKNYIKDSFTVIFFFIFFSLPLIVILINAEPDYLTRVGLIELNFDKRLIIIQHLFEKLLSIEFILIFLSLTASYVFLKKKKIGKIESINLLYFLYIGSFLAPIFFIIFSPTASEMYHFMNLMISTAFFVLMIFIFLITFHYIKNFSIRNYMLATIFIVSIIFYVFYSYESMKDKSLIHKRNDFKDLIFHIDKMNIGKKDSILTFDGKVQTYLILKDYNNLPFVLSINTPQNDDLVEYKIMEMFKFFNLDKDDFFDFIKNKKHGWRYINNNIGKTFLSKYQANSLTTYNDSNNFSEKELESIRLSSPFHSQQLIIPQFEIQRLISKFENFESEQTLKPKLIVVNLNDSFSINISLNDDFYCSKIINNTYKIYYVKNNIECN
jgi:hypothetical protein